MWLILLFLIKKFKSYLFKVMTSNKAGFFFLECFQSNDFMSSNKILLNSILSLSQTCDKSENLDLLDIVFEEHELLTVFHEKFLRVPYDSYLPGCHSYIRIWNLMIGKNSPFLLKRSWKFSKCHHCGNCL